MNPDRYDLEWEPAYNLIALSVGKAEGRRVVEVELHLRRWQRDPERFVPVIARDCSDVRRQRLSIEGPTEAVQLPEAHAIDCIAIRHDGPLMSGNASDDLFRSVYYSERVLVALGLRLQYECSTSGMTEEDVLKLIGEYVDRFTDRQLVLNLFVRRGQVRFGNDGRLHSRAP